MSDALSRQIRLLQLLPGHPRRTTVQQLAERLHSEGLGVDERTIQRHLNELSVRFPIFGDGAKPQGWSWSADAEPIRMPMVDPGTALTYALVEEHLGRLLPRPLFEQLSAQFRDVRRVLNDTTGRPFKRWSERVALLPFGPQRLPVKIDDSVVPAVYTALLEGRQLQLHYRNATSPTAKQQVLHPLALACMGEIMYLVAVADGYEDPRQWALHRMTQAEVLDARTVEPEGFDLQRYIEQEREFEYPTDWQPRLELRVSAWLARELEERPLSSEQRIRPIRGSDDMRVTARVDYTEQLHWWLRSLGTAVEVLKPLSLRKEFTSEVNELAQRYATP